MSSFAESSEVTRQWPLEEGVGFGRVSISLLYRVRPLVPPRELPSTAHLDRSSNPFTLLPLSVLILLSSSAISQSIEVDLPPNLLGWETGTVCLGSHPIEIHAAPDHEDLIESFQTLVVSTSDTTEKLGKKKAKVEGEVATFDIDSLRVSLHLSVL
jgi:hypothetical protein